MLALAGCGRLAFDPIPSGSNDDASNGDGTTGACANPIGHDEDADGVDDACDRCPHLADALQPDADGDKVGDACDPNPAEPRDRIVFFDPFTSARAEWTFNGAAGVIANDSLVIDARITSSLADLATGVPANDVYAVGGHVGAGVSAQRQIHLSGFAPLTGYYYYCEIDGDQTPAAVFAATKFDGAFVELDAAVATGPIENRDFSLELRNHPPTYDCRSSWPAARSQVAAAIPATVTATQFTLGVGGIQVRLDYFIQIHSD